MFCVGLNGSDPVCVNDVKICLINVLGPEVCLFSLLETTQSLNVEAQSYLRVSAVK